MGNAVAELKAAADRIAPCHDSDGIVEVIRWLLECRCCHGNRDLVEFLTVF